MFWLSICQTSEALDPVAGNSRPWANMQRFWRFCQRYGEYQSLPPSQRRKFAIAMAQTSPGAKPSSVRNR
jgi:hypothetical protein